jgi:signal transduction histidine kinase
VPPEYQELIFRKFETVKLTGALRARGSGLGLAFCRLVVEATAAGVGAERARRGRRLSRRAPRASAVPVKT